MEDVFDRRGVSGTECGCDQTMGSTYVGGIGFDPFSGAGTTCMQLKKQMRNWFGCELNQKYINDSILRIDRECGLLL